MQPSVSFRNDKMDVLNFRRGVLKYHTDPSFEGRFGVNGLCTNVWYDLIVTIRIGGLYLERSKLTAPLECDSEEKGDGILESRLYTSYVSMRG